MGDGGILLEELVHLFLRHVGVRFQQPIVEIEGIVIAQPARGVIFAEHRIRVAARGLRFACC